MAEEVPVTVTLNAEDAREFAAYWADAKPTATMRRAIICQRLAAAIVALGPEDSLGSQNRTEISTD